MTKNRLYCDDNLKILPTMEKESVDLNPKKCFFGRFFVPFVLSVPFRGNKSAPIPSKNMFLSGFTNGTLQNGPATVDEASVDACIEQRFGQRRQSRLKQNPCQSCYPV